MKKRTLISTAALAVALLAQGRTAAQELPPAPPSPAGAVAPAVAPVAAVAPSGMVTPALAAAPGVYVVSSPAPPAAPALYAIAQSPAPAPAPTTPAAPAIVFAGDNFLGIDAEEITRENMSRYGLTGEPRGVGVREVVKGSPAERAGLRENDLIVRFDGEQVSSIRKLNRLIDESAPEHNARLTIRRGGSEQEIGVTLGKRGDSFSVFNSDDWRRQSEEWKKQGEQWKKQGEEWRKRADEMRQSMEDWRKNNPGMGFPVIFGGGRRIGVSTESLGKQLADYFGVSHGVLLTSVSANSPADKAGLKAGDIVTEADGEKIEDSGDLSGALNRKDEGEVTLTVVRDRKSRTVRVTPEKGSRTFEFAPGAFALEAPRATITIPRVHIAPMRFNFSTPRVRVTPRPARPYTPRRIL